MLVVLVSRFIIRVKVSVPQANLIIRKGSCRVVARSWINDASYLLAAHTQLEDVLEIKKL